MILDTTKAEQILNQTGMPRKTLVLGADENATRNSLFQEMVYLRFEDGYNSKVDEDLDEELHDFIDTVQFEMKDLDFALVYEDDNWHGNPISLYVSYRDDPSWDRHMEVPFIDNSTDWACSMEQAWEYTGDKTIDELRQVLEAEGGTWSEKLKSYFV